MTSKTCKDHLSSLPRLCCASASKLPFLFTELVQSYEKQEGAELEVCARMAWRRRELAEELGAAADARHAINHARALAKHLRKRARKEKHDPPPPPR